MKAILSCFICMNAFGYIRAVVALLYPMNYWIQLYMPGVSEREWLVEESPARGLTRFTHFYRDDFDSSANIFYLRFVDYGLYNLLANSRRDQRDCRTRFTSRCGSRISIIWHSWWETRHYWYLFYLRYLNWTFIFDFLLWASGGDIGY